MRKRTLNWKNQNELLKLVHRKNQCVYSKLNYASTQENQSKEKNQMRKRTLNWKNQNKLLN